MKNKRIVDKSQEIGMDYLTALSTSPGSLTWPLMVGMDSDGRVLSASIFPNPDSEAQLIEAAEAVQLARPHFVTLIVMAEVRTSSFGAANPVLTTLTFDMADWQSVKTTSIIFSGGDVIFDPSENESLSTPVFDEIAEAVRTLRLPQGTKLKQRVASLYASAMEHRNESELIGKLLDFQSSQPDDLLMAGHIMNAQIYGLGRSPQSESAMALLLPDSLSRHIGIGTNRLLMTNPSLSHLRGVLSESIFGAES